MKGALFPPAVGHLFGEKRMNIVGVCVGVESMRGMLLWKERKRLNEGFPLEVRDSDRKCPDLWHIVAEPLWPPLHRGS